MQRHCMKFTSVKRTIFWLGCLTAAAALAEAPQEFFSESASAKGEGVQFTKSSDEIKRKPEDNILFGVRCWQNGVLIVDETNWRSPQLQSRFVAMKPMEGSEQGLYLVDFFNTFCQIKKH